MSDSGAIEKVLVSLIACHGPEAMAECQAQGITVEHLAHPLCRRVFEGALRLHQRGALFADPDTVLDECLNGQEPRVKPHDLAEAISHGNEAGVLTPSINRIARELRRRKLRRDLEADSIRLKQAVADKDDAEAEKIVRQMRERERELLPRATLGQIAGMEEERVRAELAGEPAGDPRELAWPWRDFNKVLRPFRRGELCVIAGAPSLGKTTLMRQLLAHWAFNGHNCGLASLEMTAAQIFKLMATTYSGVPYARLKEAHPAERDDYLGGVRAIGRLSLDILDDTSSLAGITAWARRLHERKFVDALAIDYLGLIAETKPGKGENKASAVGQVTADVKRLAKELGCVVLLGVQINREAIKEGRAPRMADLRDSGDIEAHADRILLLHRPDEDAAGLAQSTEESAEERPRFWQEIRQDKGRDVGTGMLPAWYHREVCRFELVGHD